MAVLYISEYASLAPAQWGGTDPSGLEPSTDQIVAIGGTTAQSTAFAASTRFVRLHTDAICNVKFGTNPTAVANTSKRLAANQTEIFAVPQGQAYKVAVIAGT